MRRFIVNAIARHIGVKLDNDDWEKIGYDMPLLVNLQPAGEYLGEDYYRAGGVPAVVAELVAKGKIKPAHHRQRQDAGTRTARAASPSDRKVILPYDKPMKKKAGFLNLKRQPVRFRDHEDQRDHAGVPQALSREPEGPDGLRGQGDRLRRAGGLSRTASTIRRSKIDEHSVLFIRGVGPIGYPGAAEVVNMRPPDYLLKKGITALPCIGDGRQSGTSGSPSILNASPEAATGGGLALLKTGDKVRIDLKKRTANILISDEELAERRAALKAAGGYKYPPSQTPWQEIQRGIVDELSKGMVLKPAVKYQKIHKKFGVPRDNH